MSDDDYLEYTFTLPEFIEPGSLVKMCIDPSTWAATLLYINVTDGVERSVVIRRDQTLFEGQPVTPRHHDE